MGAVAGALANVAPTLFAAVIETLHVEAVSVQAPDQPVKPAPEDGDAVRMTSASMTSVAVHVVPPFPQLMPPPATRPGPVTLTVSGTVALTNVAVTLFDSSMTMTQLVTVPPHAPLQPPNAAPFAGMAATAIDVPTSSFARHVSPLLPQLIWPPPPAMFPAPETETRSSTIGENVAVTDLASLIRTTQVEVVPEQAPRHSVNALPSLAWADRRTLELTASVAEHVVGQAMPTPLTLPSPDTETVRSTPVELAQPALTERSPVSSTVQATLVPSHAPPQPVKTLSAEGVCRIVNVDAVRTVHAHFDPAGADPQSISPPLTFPLPVYDVESVLVVTGGPAKFARTVVELPSTGISQVFSAVTVGQPVQPSKPQPSAAAGVNVATPPPENAM